MDRNEVRMLEKWLSSLVVGIRRCMDWEWKAISPGDGGQAIVAADNEACR